jgi:hypothetical protein
MLQINFPGCQFSYKKSNTEVDYSVASTHGGVFPTFSQCTDGALSPFLTAKLDKTTNRADSLAVVLLSDYPNIVILH